MHLPLKKSADRDDPKRVAKLAIFKVSHELTNGDDPSRSVTVRMPLSRPVTDWVYWTTLSRLRSLLTHVIDTGDGISSSVPVHDGYALPGAVVRLDLGGRLKRVRHEASV